MFLIINNMKKFEWWWKFSIFGRNSRILKVLAHEISDEIPKKLKFLILMVWWREVIIIISHYKQHERIWVVVEVFNILSKFLSFKDVSPQNKGHNPEKIKIFDFNRIMKRVNNYFSHNKPNEKFWVVVEVFNFW